MWGLMKSQVRLIWHSSKAWQAFKWALVGFQVRPYWRFPAWGIFKVGVSRNSEWWGLSRELMTLMKYHTEAGSERRWKPYNRGTVGAWSNGGCLRVLPEHLLVRMMNGICPRNKRSQYVTSLSLFCAIGTSVIVFSLCFLRFSVCPM